MTDSVPLCLFLSGFAFTELELDLESLSDRNVKLLPISCFPEQYFFCIHSSITFDKIITG